MKSNLAHTHAPRKENALGKKKERERECTRLLMYQLFEIYGGISNYKITGLDSIIGLDYSINGPWTIRNS